MRGQNERLILSNPRGALRFGRFSEHSSTSLRSESPRQGKSIPSAKASTARKAPACGMRAPPAFCRGCQLREGPRSSWSA